MATRKIRLTLSGTQVDGQGPIVDIDFNGENLDIDVDITAVEGIDTIVKEYTVDVDAGVYNLDVTYKNDIGGDVDRNLVIELIEIADNGIDYTYFIPSLENSNLDDITNQKMFGFAYVVNPDWDPTKPTDESNPYGILNPNYNDALPRTDRESLGWTVGSYPGNNPKFLFEWAPIKIWESKIPVTFNLTFN